MKEYLTKYISKIYDTDSVIYPDITNVLKFLELCPINTAKVVLLGQDPYHDGSATGIAFANYPGGKISPSLRIIMDRVKELYGFYPNPSLELWAKQGVLLLNTSLTVLKGTPGAHIEYWNPFMKFFLNTITSENKDLIFILWGKRAYNFIPQVNNCRYVTYYHPAYSIYSGKKWECNSFVEVNEYLKSINKQEIVWYL